MSKWVLAIIMLGGNLAMDRNLIQGGVAIIIPSHFMLQKPELSAGLMDHLARKQTLRYWIFYFIPFVSITCPISLPEVTKKRNYFHIFIK